MAFIDAQEIVTHKGVVENNEEVGVLFQKNIGEGVGDNDIITNLRRLNQMKSFGKKDPFWA